MADVNWNKYRCDICLMIGLLGAAVVAALVGAFLIGAGAPVLVSLVIFFAVWAALGYVVDGRCRSSATEKAGTAGDVMTIAASGVSADVDLSAEKGISAAIAARSAQPEAGVSTTDAQDWAAARGETAEPAQERVAEVSAASLPSTTAEAERRAEEQRAAEEAAEAERRAEEERAAAEAAEAERKAAGERAAAEEEEARRAAEEAAEAERREKEREAEIARATAAGEEDHDGDGTVEGSFEGTRPMALDGPRGGQADDLKRIKGIGPKLEQLCNRLGFYHFDQIAGWTADEVAWVDANLEGFKGRVTRDEWVAQARVLAGGGDTEFSKRVDDGDVPSSQ